jgi:hypothetical protein
MKPWFTIDKIDNHAHIISEYRHWEETHCYLLEGKDRALLIDTGLGICDISAELKTCRTSRWQQSQLIFIGIISEGTSIILIFMHMKKN